MGKEVTKLRVTFEKSIKDIFKKYDVPIIDFSENGISSIIHYSNGEQNDCIESIVLNEDNLSFHIISYIDGYMIEKYEVALNEISLDNLEYILNELESLKEIVE